MPVLSLFAMPKPFVGHIGMIQRNALESWRRLAPDIELILLGNDEGTRDIAELMGARHVPDVARNASGAPLLGSLFALGEAAAASQVVCYINADILLLGDFLTSIDHIRRGGLTRFLVTGSRWDLDVHEPLDFDGDWAARVTRRVRDAGRLYVGFDYFAYPKGALGTLPSFALGRGYWDRWILYHACRRRLDLVDASASITAIHQNHGNPHHPMGQKGIFLGEEAEFNRRLAGPGATYDERAATWRLEAGRLRRVSPRERLRRNLFRMRAAYPGAGPVIDAARGVLLRSGVVPLARPGRTSPFE